MKNFLRQGAAPSAPPCLIILCYRENAKRLKGKRKKFFLSIFGNARLFLFEHLPKHLPQHGKILFRFPQRAQAVGKPRRGAATLSPLPIGAAVVRVHGQALQGAIAHVLPDKIAGALDVIDPIFAATIALSLFFPYFSSPLFICRPFLQYHITPYGRMSRILRP